MGRSETSWDNVFQIIYNRYQTKLPVLLVGRPVLLVPDSYALIFYEVHCEVYCDFLSNMLNVWYGEKWMGRGEPVSWPARLFDLIPLIFIYGDTWIHWYTHILLKELKLDGKELMRQVKSSRLNGEYLKEYCVHKQTSQCMNYGRHFWVPVINCVINKYFWITYICLFWITQICLFIWLNVTYSTIN